MLSKLKNPKEVAWAVFGSVFCGGSMGYIIDKEDKKYFKLKAELKAQNPKIDTYHSDLFHSKLVKLGFVSTFSILGGISALYPQLGLVYTAASGIIFSNMVLSEKLSKLTDKNE